MKDYERLLIHIIRSNTVICYCNLVKSSLVLTVPYAYHFLEGKALIETIQLFYGWLAIAITLEIHHNSYICELPDKLHCKDVEFHCIEQNLKSDRWLAAANELHNKLFK